MRRILRNTLLFIITLFLIVAVGFVIWGETPARPMPEAMAALPSDSQVQVTTGKWLVFAPTATQPNTGLILYPGGRVDYRAYAPTARQIAEQGYLVIIVRMPLNLAVLVPMPPKKSRLPTPRSAIGRLGVIPWEEQWLPPMQ